MRDPALDIYTHTHTHTHRRADGVRADPKPSRLETQVNANVPTQSGQGNSLLLSLLTFN